MENHQTEKLLPTTTVSYQGSVEACCSPSRPLQPPGIRREHPQHHIVCPGGRCMLMISQLMVEDELTRRLHIDAKRNEITKSCSIPQHRGCRLDLSFLINTNWDWPLRKEENQHQTVSPTPNSWNQPKKILVNGTESWQEVKKSEDGS